MPIVRSDRRPFALQRFHEVREMLHSALVEVGAALAAMDDLELRLGLVTESDLANRAQYFVTHLLAGDKEAHTLDECVSLGCVPNVVPDDEPDDDGGEEGTTPDTET